jgi:hypothetical protein
MIIQLRAPAVPLARPVGTVGAPVPQARPVVAPAAAANVAPAPGPAEPATPLIRARKPRRDRTTAVAQIIAGIMLAGLAVGVVLALLIGYGGGFSLSDLRLDGGLAGNVIKSSDLNVVIERPSGAWQENASLRDKLQVSLIALQRNEPPGWLIIDAKDFKDHDPTALELDDEARRKLSIYFEKTLETEPPLGKLKPVENPIAGQPSHVIVFQGEVNGEHLAGECHMFHHQGIGYWIYTWKPGTADQRDDSDFADVRGRIKLLGERQKWKDLEQRRQVFTGAKIKGCQLMDATGRWQLQEDPTSYDPSADLVLFAPDPRQPKLRTKGCELQVLAIPTKPDSVAAATAYILDKHKRDSYEMTEISNAYEEGGGSKPSVGQVKGHLVRWRIQNTPERARFAMAGIVPHGDQILILYSECEWNARHTWEGQMQAIMETLKLD